MSRSRADAGVLAFLLIQPCRQVSSGRPEARDRCAYFGREDAMPVVKTRRVHHHRHTHSHSMRRQRSDQALFLLIMAGLLVMALSLGLATSVFRP